MSEDQSFVDDPETHPALRPQPGQEHRIVIIRAKAHDKRFFRAIAAIQEDHPECILHLHGAYSYGLLFGWGLRSVDTDPYPTARHGKVVLPNGREIRPEDADAHWLRMLGYNAEDLKVARNRCLYNIRSSRWASAHWNDDEAPQTMRSSRDKVDPEDPDAGQPQAKTPFVGTPTATVGDKFACDHCSLQSSCRYFREGGVCSIPGTEATDLVKNFKTRDADRIIEGLGSLMEIQLERLQEGRNAEKLSDGELNGAVTTIVDKIFNQGVKLAKLLRPELNGGPKFGVFVQNNGGQAVVTSGGSNGLVGAIVAELEANGVPRDQITPEMIQSLLSGSAQASLERGEVIDVD